ncbi:hypothetical protein B0H17DRAFT_1335778 [Mycena rosella]|uniref:Uncharacterized protein n=1 Tax=Mycena rosella TaxID=1033263 RepID=A0AAD7CXQ8_MYCRO|nr:hypothetical protein B0H17DRAFT_1335778 [Mycena rosella]
MSSDNDTLTVRNASEGGDADGYAGVGLSGVQAAPSAQQQAQLAALLSFKPSSRDVIGGIAPHIFDDQRRPYRPRPRRRATSPDCRPRPSSPAPRRSPLRLSAVISVDEHGAGAQPRRDDNIVIELYTTPSLPTETNSNPMLTPVTQRKPKRRSFRIDRVFKTFILRLK